MLRRLLITLGLLVAFLPYLGFPHSWQSVISTILGFSIVLALLFTRRKRGARVSDDPAYSTDDGKALHVERMEIEERPEMHVERETIIDTTQTQATPETEVIVEKKVTTVLHRRRKKERVASDSFVTQPTLDVPDIPSSLS